MPPSGNKNQCGKQQQPEQGQQGPVSEKRHIAECNIFQYTVNLPVDKKEKENYRYGKSRSIPISKNQSCKSEQQRTDQQGYEQWAPDDIQRDLVDVVACQGKDREDRKEDGIQRKLPKHPITPSDLLWESP